MRKRPLVIVEWNDTAAYNEWRSEDDSRKWGTIKSISVGWKLPSNRRNVTIASTRSELNECNDRQVIPRGCVTKIRYLEDKK